jgi:hypothetical protein
MKAAFGPGSLRDSTVLLFGPARTSSPTAADAVIFRRRRASLQAASSFSPPQATSRRRATGGRRFLTSPASGYEEGEGDGGRQRIGGAVERTCNGGRGGARWHRTSGKLASVLSLQLV